MKAFQLLEAASCGDSSLAIEALIRDGAETDVIAAGEGAKGYTPLMKAACKGHLDMVELLLGTLREQDRHRSEDDHSATLVRKALFAKDHQGRTALDWARLSHKPKVAKLLEREMSAIIEAERTVKAANANIARCQAILGRNHRSLLQLEHAVNTRNLDLVMDVVKSLSFSRDQFTAARNAQNSSNQEDSADFSPNRSTSAANPQPAWEKAEPFCLDIETDSGSTPLHFACTQGATQLVRMLIEKG